ncbi:hypothetical protein DM02DRAFT_468673, partial [Periconia macrospinosa]
LLELPDELLVEIIEGAAEDTSRSYRKPCDTCSACRDFPGLDKSRLKNLATVCSRFSRIVQPLLFRKISFWGERMELPARKLLRLRDALKENPQFHSYCRCVKLHISDYGRSDQRTVADDLPEWLTKTRCLQLHGGFDDRKEKTGNASTWALLNRFGINCKQIEHLCLGREGWGLYLTNVLANLNFPNLKTLDIHGISKWKQGTVTLEPERLRTAPFTSLALSDYEESPEATSLLIQWPAVLTHFIFESFYNNPHIMDYPMFESWLLIHKDTLKHVQMGYLSRRRGGRRLFNATLFPHLEFLGLSRWQSDEESLKSEADIANLLGPSVKTFLWDFGINDQHPEDWSDFEELEETWIRRLAQAAIDTKAALTTIRIQFDPYEWYSEDYKYYPWDRMDSIKDDICDPNGLALIYSEPCVTKEEWLKNFQ